MRTSTGVARRRADQLLDRAGGDQPAAADDDEMRRRSAPSRSSGARTRTPSGPRRRATCSSLRIQRMPSGSRPLTGSSSSQACGSPSSADAMPSRWPMPEREAAGPLAGDLLSRRGRSPRRRGDAGCRSSPPSRAGGCGPTGRCARRAPRAARRPRAAAPEIDVAPAVDRRVPAVGRSSPSSIRIVVDLPAPFGPEEAGDTPGRTVKLRSSTATFSPYRLVSPIASIMERPLVGLGRPYEGLSSPRARRKDEFDLHRATDPAIPSQADPGARRRGRGRRTMNR